MSDPSILPPPPLEYESYQGNRRFRSGHGLAIAAIAGLAVTCFVAVLASGSDYLQMRLLTQIQARAATPAQAHMNDVRQLIVAAVYFLCILTTTVLFLVWLYRVYKNLPSMTGRRSTYTPGWAVGYFFVPFVNIVRPYKVLQEVMVGSDRTRESSGAIAGWWWGTWILGGMISRFGGASASGPPDIQEMITSTAVSMFNHLFALVPGILAIVMVRAIDRMQAGSGRVSAMTPMTPIPVPEPVPSLIAIPPPPRIGRRPVDRT